MKVDTIKIKPIFIEIWSWKDGGLEILMIISRHIIEISLMNFQDWRRRHEATTG